MYIARHTLARKCHSIECRRAVNNLAVERNTLARLHNDGLADGYCVRTHGLNLAVAQHISCVGAYVH